MSKDSRYPHIVLKRHYNDKHISYEEYTEEEIAIIRQNINAIDTDKRLLYIEKTAQKFIEQQKSIQRQIKQREANHESIEDSLHAQNGYVRGVLSFLNNQYDLYEPIESENAVQPLPSSENEKTDDNIDISFLKKLESIVDQKEGKLNIEKGYTIINFFKDFYIRNHNGELTDKLSPKQVEVYFVSTFLHAGNPIKSKTIATYKSQFFSSYSLDDRNISKDITLIDKALRVKLYNYVIYCNKK